MADNFHKPVLLQETLDGLNLRQGMSVVDATLGGGGHSREILKLIGSGGKLYAFDQDTEVMEKTKLNLAEFTNVEYINTNFRFMKQELNQRDITGIDAVLFDLGVSSYQLDTLSRGFSWKENSPLDMRMDQRTLLTAEKILNEYSQQELQDIFWNYGEERHSRRIADRVIQKRAAQRLIGSRQLCDIVFGVVPGSYQNKLSAVSRIFQAVRIEVNQELAILNEAIQDAVGLLNPQGRIAVISFHSLEDRIVKNTFKNFAETLTIVTKKPLVPSKAEVSRNGRARSAKLRVGEKNV